MKLSTTFSILISFLALAASSSFAYTAVAQTRDAKIIGVAQHKNKIEAKQLAVQACLKSPKVQFAGKVCDVTTVAYPNSYVQFYKSHDGRIHIGLGESGREARADAQINCRHEKGRACKFFKGYRPSYFQRWRFSKKTKCWISTHGKKWCPAELK